MFNVVVTGRRSTPQVTSPLVLTLTNAQYDVSGNLGEPRLDAAEMLASARLIGAQGMCVWCRRIIRGSIVPTTSP